jgi:hypothetical protein
MRLRKIKALGRDLEYYYCINIRLVFRESRRKKFHYSSNQSSGTLEYQIKRRGIAFI